MALFVNDIFYFLPEFLFLSLLCMLLVLSIYNKQSLNSNELISSLIDLSIITLIIINICYLSKVVNNIYLSNFLLKESLFINSTKYIIISLTLIIFSLSKMYIKNKKIISFEIPLIILFSVFGMIIVISSNDLLLIYLALELQSLSIYALVSSKTSSNISTEAGLKYFILGSFISGFLLYGISLIYLIAGTTNLKGIELVLLNNDIIGSNLIILATVLITTGLLFKLSAAPFHNWTPDVFDGSSTLITLFISTVPKLIVFYLIYNLLHITLATFTFTWNHLLLISGILSIVIGCFGGLYQIKIKRLLAYSTINNMGFVLLGLSLNTKEGIKIALFYILIYIFLNFGIFTTIISYIKNKTGKELVYIREFNEIYLSNPIIALALGLNIFSLVGLPPLAGFFTKIFLLFALVGNKMFLIALFAVIVSVITGFYYVRIIKTIFFNKEKWRNNFCKLNEIALLIIYFIGLINFLTICEANYMIKLIHITLI